MAEGTVTAYDAEAGWGVVVPDDGGPRLRVHQVEVLTHGAQVLERGERVSYAVGQDDDGPVATAVTPLGPILTEEELTRRGLVPEPEPPATDRAGAAPAGNDPASAVPTGADPAGAIPTKRLLAEPPEPAKFPTPVRVVIGLVGLAALPCLVIGVIQVANGHEEWLPLLISGVIMLLVLERIPHERW
ncbi:cold-shock protein [Promicromonospora sukumoe]|uniref:cold-shock protein n=1 Tax=Promicromonospora sukumoe TaxID=88382 RepID=UPI0003743845|nr:cold shock domain-containing protein [Promicromonospora sukumoe]